MKMIWFPVTKSQFWLPQNPLEMSTGNPSTEFCNDKADGNIPRCPFKYPLVWLERLTVLQPYWLHFSLFTCFFLCFSVRLMQRLLLPQKHNQKQKTKPSNTDFGINHHGLKAFEFYGGMLLDLFFFITMWYFPEYALESSLLFVYTWGNPELRVAPLFHAKSSVWNIKVRQ